MELSLPHPQVSHGPGQQVVNLPTKHNYLEQTDYFMNVDHKVELRRTTRGVCWFGIVLMKL